ASRAPGLASPIFSLAGRRSLRQAPLAIVLPGMVVRGWQMGGEGGSLFGGVLPTPDRAWQAWKVWAFGSTGLSLNPYSGTWLPAPAFFAPGGAGAAFFRASW